MEERLIKQHNLITEAHYEMSALEKNVVYMLMRELKESDPSKKIYTLSIKALQRITGRDVDHTQFARSIDKLVNKVLYIKQGDLNYKHFNLLSSGKYKKNLGIVELELSKEIRTFFFALKNNFTSFQLQVALSLKSKYSKRLYEMLSQYKDTEIFVVNLIDLMTRLGIVDTTTGQRKYSKYGLFKTKVLEVAQKELSQKADFTFSYEAIKSGKKYTQLYFHIKKTSQAGLQELKSDQGVGKREQVSKEEQSPGRKKLILEQLVKKYKLSSWQAEKILQSVPLEEIRETTYAIQLELRNNRVTNLGGYTATVFDQKYKVGLFKE